eukprot:1507795-Prymnesium_polylepis.1
MRTPRRSARRSGRGARAEVERDRDGGAAVAARAGAHGGGSRGVLWRGCDARAMADAKNKSRETARRIFVCGHVWG